MGLLHRSINELKLNFFSCCIIHLKTLHMLKSHLLFILSFELHLNKILKMIQPNLLQFYYFFKKIITSYI